MPYPTSLDDDLSFGFLSLEEYRDRARKEQQKLAEKRRAEVERLGQRSGNVQALQQHGQQAQAAAELARQMREARKQQAERLRAQKEAIRRRRAEIREMQRQQAERGRLEAEKRRERESRATAAASQWQPISERTGQTKQRATISRALQGLYGPGTSHGRERYVSERVEQAKEQKKRLTGLQDRYAGALGQANSPFLPHRQFVPPPSQMQDLAGRIRERRDTELGRAPYGQRTPLGGPPETGTVRHPQIGEKFPDARMESALYRERFSKEPDFLSKAAGAYDTVTGGIGESVLDIGQDVSRNLIGGLSEVARTPVDIAKEALQGDIRGIGKQVGQGLRAHGRAVNPIGSSIVRGMMPGGGLYRAATEPKALAEEQVEEYRDRPWWQQMAVSALGDPTTYVGSGALGFAAKGGKAGRILAGVDKALDVAQGGPLFNKFGSLVGRPLKPIRQELLGGAAGAAIGGLAGEDLESAGIGAAVGAGLASPVGRAGLREAGRLTEKYGPTLAREFIPTAGISGPEFKGFKGDKEALRNTLRTGTAEEYFAEAPQRLGRPVGLPKDIQTPEDLEALRDILQEQVIRGMPEGKDWYPRSARYILDYVDNNYDEAIRFARGLANWSPRTAVIEEGGQSNVPRTLRAFEQEATGKQINTGAVAATDERWPGFATADLAEKWNTGPKISSFASNLEDAINLQAVERGLIDELPPLRGAVTIDAYSRQPVHIPEGSVKGAAYDWGAEEFRRAGEGAGLEHPFQAQSSQWVFKKSEQDALEFNQSAVGQKLIRDGQPPRSPEYYLKQNSLDYSHAFEQGMWQVNYETAPGRGSKLLPVYDALTPEDKAEYHKRMSEIFLDEDGKDVLADAVGIKNAREFAGPGFYQNVTSPAGHVMLFSDDTVLVDIYAAVRGLVLEQTEQGYERPIYTAATEEKNGVSLVLERAVTEDESRELGRMLRQYTGHNIVPIPSLQGVRVTDYSANPLPYEELDAAVKRVVEEVFPQEGEIRGYGYKSDGKLLPKNDWTVSQNGEVYRRIIAGSGRPNVQRRLHSLLPELQRRARSTADEFARATGPGPEEPLVEFRAGFTGRDVASTLKTPAGQAAAGAAVGATLDEEDRWRGATLGAAAGLGAGQLAKRSGRLGRRAIGDSFWQDVPLDAPVRVDAGRVPNALVREGAQAYNAAVGLGRIPEGHYVPVDEGLARQIADAYDALPAVDQSPETIRAYEALGREIDDQWNYATEEMGVNFEPWTKEGQPYANSAEMVSDIRDNQHLYFFTGGEPHPFLGEVDPASGLSLNDKFRAVHDLFGHSAEGYAFGPRGEENAWLKHTQMFSPEARKAMASETRGQNSWVNFGRHNYDEAGNHLNLPLPQRPYAEQKAALLPDELLDADAAFNRARPSPLQPPAAPLRDQLRQGALRAGRTPVAQAAVGAGIGAALDEEDRFRGAGVGALGALALGQGARRAGPFAQKYGRAAAAGARAGLTLPVTGGIGDVGRREAPSLVQQRVGKTIDELNQHMTGKEYFKLQQLWSDLNIKGNTEGLSQQEQGEFRELMRLLDQRNAEGISASLGAKPRRPWEARMAGEIVPLNERGQIDELAEEFRPAYTEEDWARHVRTREEYPGMHETPTSPEVVAEHEAQGSVLAAREALPGSMHLNDAIRIVRRELEKAGGARYGTTNELIIEAGKSLADAADPGTKIVSRADLESVLDATIEYRAGLPGGLRTAGKFLKTPVGQAGAGAAVGSYLNEEDRRKGALIGAAAGLAGGAALRRPKGTARVAGEMLRGGRVPTASYSPPGAVSGGGHPSIGAVPTLPPRPTGPRTSRKVGDRGYDAADQALGVREATTRTHGPISRAIRKGSTSDKRVFKALRPLEEFVKAFNPAIAQAREVLVSYQAKGSVSSMLKSEFWVTRQELLERFGKEFKEGASGNLKYIGPADNDLKHTILDAAQNRHHYDLTDAQKEVLDDMEWRNFNMLKRIREEYGVDILPFNAPKGSVYLPNLSKKTDLEEQAFEEMRKMQSLGRSSIAQERQFDSAYERLLKDKDFDPETDINALLDYHDSMFGEMAGRETMKRGLGGKTAREVADELDASIGAQRDSVTNQIASVTGKIDRMEKRIAKSKGRREVIARDFRRTLQREQAIKAEVDALGQNYGPELSHLAGQHYELERRLTQLQRDVRTHFLGKSTTMGDELTALRKDLRNVKRQRAVLRNKYDAAIRNSDYAINPETHLYHKADVNRQIKGVLQTKIFGDIHALNKMTNAADEVRLVTFSADLSPLTIQGAIAMLMDPVSAFRMSQIKSMSRQIAKGGELLRIAKAEPDLVRRYTFATGHTFGDIGADVAVQGRGLERLPKVGGWNRQMIDTVEVRLFNQWKNDVALLKKLNPNMSDAQADFEAGRALSQIVPRLNPAERGRSQAGARIERLALTSPSFAMGPSMLIKDYASGLTKLSMGKTPTGREQLALIRGTTLMGTLAGISATSAVLSAEANNKDPWEAVQEVLDPTSSRFMHIMIGKEGSIPMAGPLMSVMKPTAKLLSGKGDPVEIFRRFGSAKMQPVLGTTYDLVRNKDYFGKEIYKGAAGERVGRGLWYIAENLLPLPIGAGLETVRKGDLSVKTAIGAGFASLGQVLGTAPMPRFPGEDVTRMVRDLYGVDDWSELNAAQKNDFERNHPDAYRDMVEASSAEFRDYEQQRRDIRTESQGLDEALSAPGREAITKEDFWDEQGNLQQRVRQAGTAAFGEGGEIEGEDSFSEYMRIIDEHTTKGAGDRDVVDWDAVEQERARMEKENPGWNAEVDESVGASYASPYVRAVNKYLRPLLNEYYDLPIYQGATAEEGYLIDEVWGRFKDRVEDGEVPKTVYDDLTELYPDAPDIVWRGIQMRFEGKGIPRSKERERFKAEHPELDIRLGQGYLTESEKAWLEEHAEEFR